MVHQAPPAPIRPRRGASSCGAAQEPWSSRLRASPPRRTDLPGAGGDGSREQPPVAGFRGAPMRLRPAPTPGRGMCAVRKPLIVAPTFPAESELISSRSCTIMDQVESTWFNLTDLAYRTPMLAKTRFSAALDEGGYGGLSDPADRHGTSITRLVRRAVAGFLERRRREESPLPLRLSLASAGRGDG